MKKYSLPLCGILPVIPAVMAAAPAGSGPGSPPNVIVIMTDDQGYGDISAHGNPIFRTPHLDRLHAQSIRLTDFHVAPMSTPTRGQLLTGMDAPRNGAVNVSSGRSLLRRDVPTMGDYFTEAGYSTAIFGKWHLGDNYPFRPEDRGFGEALWFPSSHIGSVPDYWGNDYFDDTYIHNGVQEACSGFCTDVFFSRAKEWISSQARERRPFLLYLPLNAPHQPFYAPEKDIAEMEKVVAKAHLPGMNDERKHNFIRFLAMIRNIDDNIGELMKFLDDSGLSENTIVVFLTDNGSTFGPDYYNAGMRGGKTQLYEGGHRVPLFMRWNGGLKGGKDIDGLTQAQDILPTLLELCEIDFDPAAFDGMSLAPVLHGRSPLDDDRMMFINFSRMPFVFDYPSPCSPSQLRRSGTAVLWKKWRLLGNGELYDLSADPGQQNNVIGKNPDVAAVMTAGRDRWWAGLEDIANRPERIVLGGKEDPLLLTACEWMDVFVDQQAQVRKGLGKNSFWLLEVADAGIYEFELRRWPRESGLKLSDADAGDTQLDIRAARIFIHSAERDVNMRKTVNEQADAVRFRCDLPEGNIALHTWFYDAGERALAGAYYVYVNKLN